MRSLAFIGVILSLGCSGAPQPQPAKMMADSGGQGDRVLQGRVSIEAVSLVPSSERPGREYRVTFKNLDAKPVGFEFALVYFTPEGTQVVLPEDWKPVALAAGESREVRGPCGATVASKARVKVRMKE